MAELVKGALVLTTIFDPMVLESYFQNFKAYGHLEDIQVFVIPDQKTPRAAYERCAFLKQRGLRVICPSLDEQETFLKRVGFPPHLIPYNSDNRRNIGYLMALESGACFVISIDDDNYCCHKGDFFAEHAIVCKNQVVLTIVDSVTGWFNACGLLELDRPGDIYARGFPYYARHRQENLVFTTAKVDVHMNAGLWLLDPDVDGITWLVAPTHAVSFKGKSLGLGRKTWSPLNSQNTSLRRDVVASYYFVKMGYPLAGMPIDRYGDIFSGYFAQACVRHLNGTIRIGTPIVEHRRNSHNYLKDASNEWACILVLEDLLPWLTEEVELEGSSHGDVYISLSHAIEDAVEHFNGRIWTDATRGYFHQMAYHMRRWAAVCKSLS